MLHDVPFNRSIETWNVLKNQDIREMHQSGNLARTTTTLGIFSTNRVINSRVNQIPVVIDGKNMTWLNWLNWLNSPLLNMNKEKIVNRIVDMYTCINHIWLYIWLYIYIYMYIILFLINDLKLCRHSPKTLRALLQRTSGPSLKRLQRTGPISQRAAIQMCREMKLGREHQAALPSGILP